MNPEPPVSFDSALAELERLSTHEAFKLRAAVEKPLQNINAVQTTYLKIRAVPWKKMAWAAGFTAVLGGAIMLYRRRNDS